jgi:GNAT superfamily N-acetyltransferase
MIEIKPLQESDISRAVEIVSFHKPDHGVMAARDLGLHFKNNYRPDSFFIGASYNGQLAGIMGMYKDPDEDVSGIIWAVWLYVDPSYRKLGIGNALHEAIIEEATRRGARKLMLDVGDANEHAAAISMYLKRGYQMEANLRDYFRPGEDKLIYGLYL